MDRKWMYANRLSKEYRDGVKEFIRFAVEHADDPNKIICPCLKCCFGRLISATELEDHLVCHGIDRSYTHWTKHGQTNGEYSDERYSESCASNDFDTRTYEANCFEEMTNVIGDELKDCPEMFERLKSDAEKPLYTGCTKFTILSAVSEMYNLKAGNGWSDKSFTELLTLLKDMLPEDNKLPNQTYEAKQLLCSIGMSYEKIHACTNDCILFRKEYALLDKCPKCNAPRYKEKELSPAKVVWYFPIIPRFRRMYNSAENVKHLTWHADERIQDGKFRHPADSPQWKRIDSEYEDFGEEDRNLRLALSTDGMNLHGMPSSTHSTWPVVLVIYNLPPWLCMKPKFMILSMLISGPKQPGNDIDVFLAPLIEDLKLMWEKGVEVYDGYRKETFNLRAMLFGTINNFPVYGNLSGYSIEGQCGCPICEEGTHFVRLEHDEKFVFLGHRRFLPQGHRYRWWRKAFNGNTEEGKGPLSLSGEDLFCKVKDLNNNFGKPFARHLGTSGWKKKSIFFELPYWKLLYVRHFLDVMHIEKNVCDNIIGTLLNMPGKTKDGIKTRLDLVAMGIRGELTLVKEQCRTYLPPAAYTLSRKEKIAFCEFFNGVKVPKGYFSNIRNLVSMEDLKLKGLKSHDCHVLMEHMMPVAIRSILPKKVRGTITKLCFFFRSICSKVVDPVKLPALQRQIIVTLCELEMYFPPSFFDMMVHLTVHLVWETQMCGPSYLRWMYPIECYMKVLKGYVKNQSRPESCIVERYITKEAVAFCTEYLSNVDNGFPKSHHKGRTVGKGIMGNEVISISWTQWEQAHLYVLHNSDEVKPYVEMHKEKLRSLNPNENESWISKERNRLFINWLRYHIISELERNPGSISNRLRWLANGPNRYVLSYTGYLINGYTFFTKERDDRSTMQNSGVTIAQSMHISSAKDKNPIFANMSYFGVIEHIWKLDYILFRVPVFSCKWIDNKNGLRVDESGFIQVDLNKMGYKDEPFILASQAQQVFFVPNPTNEKWSIVMLMNKTTDDQDDAQDHQDADIEDDPFFGTSLDFDFTVDDAFYMRDDHEEGIWITKRGHESQNPTRKRKR